MSQTQKNIRQQQRLVKLVDPPPGGITHVSYADAQRYVRRGRARFDSSGRLVILYGATVDHAGGGLRLNGKPNLQLLVTEFSGLDAFPGRAVMPPSPTVLRNMGGSYRGPLRPPMMRSSSNC